jgi:hypothetical protein
VIVLQRADAGVFVVQLFPESWPEGATYILFVGLAEAELAATTAMSPVTIAPAAKALATEAPMVLRFIC